MNRLLRNTHANRISSPAIYSGDELIPKQNDEGVRLALQAVLQLNAKIREINEAYEYLEKHLK